jgi:hypothetical protein
VKNEAPGEGRHSQGGVWLITLGIVACEEARGEKFLEQEMEEYVLENAISAVVHGAITFV